MTTIEIPDFVTTAKNLADMALALADLLEHAADSALRAPRSADLHEGCQEIRLSFPGHQETFHTLARWAERFGGTVTGEPYTSHGEESVHCQVKFCYLGLDVEAWAFITADEVSTT